MVLPKSNISIMMVRNALNYPSTDLGTLCSCGEKYINKWSKYKPVPNPFTNNRPSDWWRGSARNCGISFLQHATIQYMLSSIDSGVEQLPYEPPTGGSVAPYRLGDFAGYSTTALPPIEGGWYEGTYYKNYANIGFACMFGAGSEEDELTISDVFGNQLQNLYYGAALKTSNGTPLWLTSNNTVQNGGNFVEFPTARLVAGSTYYLYQFLSSIRKPSVDTAESAGQFIAIPAIQRQAIKIESSNVDLAIEADRGSNGVVSGNIYIVNRGGYHVYQNVFVQVRYGNKKPEEIMEAGETSISLGNITVQANQSLTVPFSTNTSALPLFNTRGGKVLLYMDGLLKTQSFIPQLAPNS